MRKLMWFSIGFAIACGMGIYCMPNNGVVPLMAALLAAVPVFWCMKVRPAAVVCLGCLIGFAWYLGFQRYYLIPAHAMDGVTLQTTVTVTDYSYETTYGIGADGEFELDGVTYRARIYLSGVESLEPGDTVSGSFKLRYTAPGGANDPTYHAGERILFLGYQRGGVEIGRTEASSLQFYAAKLRCDIQTILRASCPSDVFPFAQALLLGDGSELDYETDTALKISGIRHIIAVSGLHVAILYSLIRTITFRKRFLTALVGGVVMFVFAAVAGFTPSVTRSCIMIGLMMLSQVLNREYDSPTSLAFAGLVMLAVNPLVITSISFQMSFGSVAGILLFQEKLSDWMKKKLGEPKGKNLPARMKKWFISSVSVTLSAITLTTPLSAYYFGTVSLIGVLTNLLTLWVVNFVFNGLVVLCLVSLLSAKAAALMGSILAWPARYVLGCAKLLSDFPLAAVYTKSVYITLWLVFVYGLLAVFLLSRKRKPLILSCCAALGLCVALMASWLEPLATQVRLTALDVGQGQSLLLQHRGRTYLIDCGGDNDEMAADAVAETLLSQGITKLDGVILTHGDRDHAGGMPYLLSRIDTRWIMVPATTDRAQAEQLAHCSTGQLIFVDETLTVTLDDTKISIFGPVFPEESNENSLCVLFESEKCVILVTGDRGFAGELALVSQADLPKVDLLVAGHHGSKNSTSQRLLQTVKPETVFISVGEDNPYGHPSDELLDRLDEFGCEIYRTDQNGTIIFRR